MRDAKDIIGCKTFNEVDYNHMINKEQPQKIVTREKPYILKAIQKGQNKIDIDKGDDQH